MKNGMFLPDEVDPNEVTIKYGEPEDYVDPLDLLAPRSNAMVEDARHNTFFLFSEHWEEYTVSEVSDVTMRFRLAVKYKGIFMRDVSDDSDDDGDTYDDYRVVVDLEWSTGKINDYGKKRGWLIVCELISPFHDGAIAEAGDNKALIREAYVVNERFFSCVKAAPARLQTRPLKSQAEAFPEGNRGGGGGP
jgi:hypothetical protein